MRRLLLFMLLLGVSAMPVRTAVAGLPDALRAAMAHHPAIQGKLAEVTAQGYNVKTTRSGRYPSLSGQVKAVEGDDEYGVLSVRQPLWAFGKISLPIARAEDQLEAERMALLQLQRGLVEDTATVYAQLQGLREQLTVAGENINEHRKLYDRIEHRKAGQLASAADVQLALSRLIRARAQREEIVAELQVAKDELKSLTQVPVSADAPVDTAFTALPDPAILRQLAVEESPDIRYKNELIDVAQHTVSIQKAASTPTLYAEAEWEFWDHTTQNEARVGLTLEGSLDGVGLGAVNRIRAASAQVAAIRQDWKSTLNDVELGVSRLLTNLQLQTRLQVSQEAAVDAVRETRDSYMRQYDTGRKNWLEVLNMQRELTEQRLELVRVESSRLVLSLRLAALTGRLDAAAGIKPISE